jgi:phenylalanyl-tRNA synthetase beta chain
VRQPGGLPELYRFRHRVRDALMRAGLREVWLFPFASDADQELTGDTDAIRVTNPLQSDDRWLRTRLTPGLLKAIRRNAYRQVRGTALFEVSTVFRMVDGQAQERPKVAIAMTGTAESAWNGRREYDFFDAKGVVEALMADLGIAWTLGEPVAGGPFHPGRSAFILVDGARVGVLGEIHPRVADSLDVPGRIAVAELEVSLLMEHAATTVEAHDVPKFPPVRRDLAFVLDERITHAAVETAIRDAGGDLVATCVLFDVHSGPPLPTGKKSLAYSVDFRDPTRTLEREEADEAVARIRARVAEELGGELREGGGEARERRPV